MAIRRLEVADNRLKEPIQFRRFFGTDERRMNVQIRPGFPQQPRTAAENMKNST